MTTQSFGETDPRVELARSRALARRVRQAQRATWFPLLVFALLTFLAIPVIRTGHGTLGRCSPAQPGTIPRACVVHNSAAFVYWPIALVAGYVLIAAFYILRSRRRGVGTRVVAYVAAGLLIAVAVTATSVWADHQSPLTGQYDVLAWHLRGPDVYRLIGPACAIGLGLLVLAAVERSAALLAVTVTYLIIALGGVDLGWSVSHASRWGFAPHLVIQGGVLLVASIGFSAAQLFDQRGSV